jgi:hypothetical protein
MSVIEKKEEQTGTRILCIGSPKLIIEDWMIKKINKPK